MVGCVRVHDDDEQPRGHARVKYIFDIVVLAKMPYMINQWACNITSFHLYVVWKRNSRRVGPSYCALIVEGKCCHRHSIPRDDDVCK